MDDAKVKTLKQAILEPPAEEQQQLAEELLLPVLLATRAGFKGIDRAGTYRLYSGYPQEVQP